MSESSSKCPPPPRKLVDRIDELMQQGLSEEEIVTEILKEFRDIPEVCVREYVKIHLAIGE